MLVPSTVLYALMILAARLLPLSLRKALGGPYLSTTCSCSSCIYSIAVGSALRGIASTHRDKLSTNTRHFLYPSVDPRPAWTMSTKSTVHRSKGYFPIAGTMALLVVLCCLLKEHSWHFMTWSATSW